MLLREIRELGESVLCLDQHPSLISKPALGNTYTTFAFNLKHRGDIAMIQDCLHLDSEQAGYLGRLEVGWAVVKLQGRWFFPFLVKLPLVQMRKGAVTDNDVRRRYAQTQDQDAIGAETQAADSAVISSQEAGSAPIPSADRQMAGIPPAGKEENEGCAIRLTTQEGQFLTDVWEHPTSTVTDHHHSLNLSPRRGTGLQKVLLRRTLISSCPIVVGRSRIKVLALTERGKKALGINEAESDRLGGPEHRYWKRRLAEHLSACGYDVTEEYPLGGGKAIDLLAVKNGQRLAIEVETGKSDAAANVRKCLNAGFRQVVVVTTHGKNGLARALQREDGSVLRMTGTEALAHFSPAANAPPGRRAASARARQGINLSMKKKSKERPSPAGPIL